MQKKTYHDLLPYFWICLACLMVYFPVVFFDFQRGWDDGWMVMNHYTVLGFTWDNLRAVFTQYHVTQYSPLNELIYMTIHAAFGYNSKIYHLYPLLFHIANSYLVFMFIQRLVNGHTDPVTARRISFTTALLFVIHPLQVESIAWISASKIPLYTFFALLAMLSYIRYIRSGKIRFYIGALLLFLCSFGSKEQSVVLPFNLLLIDWLFCRTPIICGEKLIENSIEKKTWVYILIEKMPFLLFALFAGLSTYANQSAGTIERWSGYPMWQRMIFACYALTEYFGKMSLPVNLLYLYPFPMAPGKELPSILFIYPAVFVTTICILFKVFRRKDWTIIFGLLFFFINILLMLHLVAMSRFCIVADRYVYLSSVGIFFIAAWYAIPWLQKMAVTGKKWILIVAACYLVYLGGYAHYRTYAWENSDTLKKELRELINVDVKNKHQQIHQNQ